MARFERYSRLSGDDRYRSIAEQNILEFERLNPTVLENNKIRSDFLSNYKSPQEPPPEFDVMHSKHSKIEEARDRAATISVVFTAMYFEAFIYDYAASCLGDSYTKKHLDKIDFISKWLIIPKLITGKTIEKSSRAYDILRTICKHRNDLVHLKSREMNFTTDEMGKYFDKNEQEIQEAVNACRDSFYIVLKELHYLDPEHPKVRFAVERCNIDSY